MMNKPFKIDRPEYAGLPKCVDPAGQPALDLRFQISDEPVDTGEPTVPLELVEREAELFALTKSNPADALGPLLEWVDRYPHVPTIKNWVAMCHFRTGQIELADAMIDRIVAEHPGYLFGRTQLAMRLINDNRADEVPDALDQRMELPLFYPHRNLFHISEAIALYTVLAQYFMATMQFRQAEYYVGELNKMNPGHDAVVQTNRLWSMVSVHAKELRGQKENPRRFGSHSPKKGRNRKARKGR